MRHCQTLAFTPLQQSGPLVWDDTVVIPGHGPEGSFGR